MGNKFLFETATGLRKLLIEIACILAQFYHQYIFVASLLLGM